MKPNPSKIQTIALRLCLAMILLSSENILGQTNPMAGDILFTHADADFDVFEFITLKRLNLTSLYFADHGICANNTFRKTEDTFGLSQFALLADIPAGTLVRIAGKTSTTYMDDLDAKDGIITLKIHTLSLSGTGDQIIAYTGTPYGNSSCTAIGVNNYIAGINWAVASGWNSGSTSSNNSKAPGTGSDYASTNGLESIWYNGTIAADTLNIRSATGNGVRNPLKWTGTNTGTGVFTPLKNIQFHASNFATGNIQILNSSSNYIDLNLSYLTFDSTNTDTRYMVIVSENSLPSLPLDRYTCYSPNSNFLLADSVVTTVASPPCNGAAFGLGKLVYFNYTLPGFFHLSGLNSQTCYYVQVIAVNGNGYSANVGAASSSFQFILYSPVLTAY
jgi:hypothetical protein